MTLITELKKQKPAEEWVTSRLGDHVATKTKGIVPNKTPNDIFELYSVPSHEYGIPEIVTGKEIGSNKQIVEEGTVLLCKINPRINRTWVVAGHSQHQKIASTEWITFPPTDEFIPKYLAYFLQQDPLRDFLAANASGVGGSLMRVKPATVSDYPFPIAPKQQQQRIVAEIEKQYSRLDEAVTALKRIQANLKRYKAAVLKVAVEGKLTEQWRKEHPDVEPADQLLKRILAERRAKWEAEELAKMKAKGTKPKDDSWKKKYKEPAGPDTANLPELPEGWVWARAEQVSDFITKGTTPAATKMYEGSGDIRFIKVYNLTFSGRLNYNYKAAFVDQSVHEEELARSKVVAGDVLINIVGPPLGQVSVVPAEIKEANINQAIARIRSLNGVLNRFLAFTLMTESVMSWAIKRAKTTAGQSNLTLELCRDLPIPLPSFVEQGQIAAEIDRSLSVAEELETTIETNLKRAERLRQTILQRSFSGVLT
ncbi:MAG TPA: restriction endonuclease subunit S [Geobacteraceae bacterium]